MTPPHPEPTERRRNALAAFIHAELQRKGISRPAFTELVGMSSSTTQKLLNEDTPPVSFTPGQLERMAEVLDTTVEALVQLWEAAIERVDDVDLTRERAVFAFRRAAEDADPSQLEEAVRAALAALGKQPDA